MTKTPVKIRPLRRFRPASVTVTSLSIDKLFGKFDYKDLDFSRSSNGSGKISVIYGDNGVGKTTILRLLYSCLSPESGAGHRSLISKTPFLNFSVSLSDGINIQIRKKELTGQYDYIVKSQSINEILNIETDADGDVPSQRSVDRLETILRSLNIQLLFVDHTRTVRSTYSFLSDMLEDDATDRWLAVTYDDRTRRRKHLRKLAQFPLTKIVEAVNRWFQSQAIRQGAAGEENASAVYLEIAKALSRRKARRSAIDGERDLIAVLEDLKDQTESYHRHRLLSSYPFDDFIKLYGESSKPKQAQIRAALAPFVEAIQRRIFALRELNLLMSNFEAELGKYLGSKIASFNVADGLVIKDSQGPIDIDNLSSGEKQLLFLFCAAVVSRSARSLILIDEPELSLNFKWQRLISGSLFRLSQSTSTQYILASHSIEIITRHVDSSIELIPDAS